MTIAGFKPVYRSTVVPSVLPREATSTGVASVSTRPVDRRDTDDARRLFKAIAKGDVDSYHRVCRTTTPSGDRVGRRSPEELKRFLDHAHTLIGKTDGNLLNHAARTRPSHGKEACIALLVRDGIALDVRDAQGFTPLMRLVRDERDTASLHKLVPALSKADINQANPQDGYRTVLHYAIQAGNLAAVKALTAAGVNVNQASRNRSPVALARKAGHMDIVRHLLIKGGREEASLSGLPIRPSWSLTSLGAQDAGESRRKPVPVIPAPRRQPVADEYGQWNDNDADCIQLLTPESDRHALLHAAQ